MTLEDTSQKKEPIYRKNAYFGVLQLAYIEPQTFQEALHHKYTEEHEGWRTSIQKEFKGMINKGVRKKSKRRRIYPNKHLIYSKWVFNNERDGQFRARLLTQGCNNIT